MTKNLILIGAGGHGKACVEVVESQKDFAILGFIDGNRKIGEKVSGHNILGGDDLIKSFAKDAGNYFLVSVGQIRSSDLRQRIFKEVISANGKLGVVIASTAFVSPRATIGKGTIVMHHVIVNADSTIGENVILNNKCLIEHDCTIGHHVHISTGVIVNGGCNIGDRVFIGSGAVVANGITIGDDIILGAGSIVVGSILQPGTYAGNPARKIS